MSDIEQAKLNFATTTGRLSEAHRVSIRLPSHLASPELTSYFLDLSNQAFDEYNTARIELARLLAVPKTWIC
jgi:hypothetical protein